MTGQSFISPGLVFKPYQELQKKGGIFSGCVQQIYYAVPPPLPLHPQPLRQRQVIMSLMFLTDLVSEPLFDIRVNGDTQTDRYNHTEPHRSKNDYFKGNRLSVGASLFFPSAPSLHDDRTGEIENIHLPISSGFQNSK